MSCIMEMSSSFIGGLTIKKIWWLIYQTLGYNRGELTHRETANAWRMTLSLWCIGPAVANWSWTTSFKVFVYWPGSGKGRRSKAALPTTVWNASAKDNYSERHQAGVCGWHVQVCRAGGASPKVPFINGGNPLATTRVTTRGTFQTIWVKPAHFWVEIPPMVILRIVYDTLPPSIGWLVVWNTNFIFPFHMGCHPSHGPIFIRWVGQPPTRLSSHY